jgi:hypothetical protein
MPLLFTYAIENWKVTDFFCTFFKTRMNSFEKSCMGVCSSMKQRSKKKRKKKCCLFKINKVKALQFIYLLLKMADKK